MDALHFFARFEPLLHYALHVRDIEQNASWAEVRNQMYALAEQERSQSVPRFLTEYMDICRLAVYALVDEILLDSPRMGQESAVHWYQDRLQVRYLQTDRAGELFFVILQNLIEDILRRIRPHGTDAHATSAPHADTFRPDTFQEHFEQVVLYLLDHIHEAPAQNSAIHTKSSQHSASQSVPQEKQTPVLSIDNDVISAAECLCLAIFSLCLLYGFKGLYYGPQHVHALERTERIAALLWQGLLPKALVEQQNTSIRVAQEPAPKSSAPWLYFFILTPLILSGLWYFFCADILEHMTFYEQIKP